MVNDRLSLVNRVYLLAKDAPKIRQRCKLPHAALLTHGEIQRLGSGHAAYGERNGTAPLAGVAGTLTLN